MKTKLKVVVGELVLHSVEGIRGLKEVLILGMLLLSLSYSLMSLNAKWIKMGKW